MMRDKGMLGRITDSIALVCPLFAVWIVAAALGWIALGHGVLAGAGVIVAASIVAPRGTTLLNAYFARFIAWPSSRIADALLLVGYAVLTPVGMVIGVLEPGKSARSKSYWKPAKD